MKYTTEEERKQAKREYDKQRYQANKEKILEQQKQYKKQYYQENKEKRLEQIRQYYQDNREKLSEQKKQYYQTNKEKILEQNKQYYQENKEKRLEYGKQRYQTPMGRASKLANRHNQEDKKYNRGECSLTAQWIIDNIFTQKCIYCGESDWRKLGCDRKDNSLPHTPSNVVPCCGECNIKRNRKPFEEFLTIMTK